MKKNSGLAVLSFVLACSGLWCLLARGDTGFLALVGIILGFISLGLGFVALWRIRRRTATLRGQGWAVSAMFLGAVTTLASVLALLSLVLPQFVSDRGPRQFRDGDRYGADVNRMPDESALKFSSNLPLIVLDLEGRTISKHRVTVAQARFFDASRGRASLDSNPAYEGLVTLRRRGYSTLQLPKPSYTLHTVDAQTNQVKVSLLGLPAEADWVLYAPYEDKTLMRDVLAYELARRMGRYAPRTRFVEVFVRSGDRPLSMRDYVGVYVLVEKVKRGKERVNVAKLDSGDASEPDIAGGYILKRDHGERGESGFRTRHGGPYYYVYPKASNISAEQKRWIRQYLNTFESALYGDRFKDPEGGYAAYLDVDSFIDAHWLVELSKNVDGFRYSSFLTKDRHGKLKPEPAWDWNRSFGNANYYGGGQPRGWYWPNLRPNEISWYQRLREDPAFVRRCSQRWTALRQDVFEPRAINELIDQWAAQLEEGQKRNFRRWPVLGRQITCNHYVGDTYQEEVSWLKKWVERRVEWIDRQVGRSSEL